MTRKEAINKIKMWDFLDDDKKEVLETLIPEIRENEDEKIRKWLIDAIKAVPNDSIEWEKIDKSDVLSWLEKQGEQISKEVDLDKEAVHYLLYEHCSPLNEIMHRADLKTELQYHKDIESAFKAGFELSRTQKGG